MGPLGPCEAPPLIVREGHEMQDCEWRLLGKNAERWGWFSEWDSEATWMKSLFDSSFRVFFNKILPIQLLL